MVIVAINSQNMYHREFTAAQLYETHDYIDSSGKIFENTRSIFIDESKHAIRDKLQGSFGYTNISRASLFQEEKYMNLWVALESLARTDMYSDIISNVKETVPAAMSLRYIYRHVRNFIEDCVRCGVKFDFSTQSINMQQETKQKLVKETINVLQDAKLFSELQCKCEVNSLLYHRATNVSCLVTNVEYAKKKVENHYKQVNTYIFEIVTCLMEKGLTTIEAALCLIKDNYDVFIALINSNDKTLVEKRVLATGIIDLI